MRGPNASASRWATPAVGSSRQITRGATASTAATPAGFTLWFEVPQSLARSRAMLPRHISAAIVRSRLVQHLAVAIDEITGLEAPRGEHLPSQSKRVAPMRGLSPGAIPRLPITAP
jgi:hypothetical protein